MFGILKNIIRRWRESTAMLRRRDEHWKQTMRRRQAEELKTTAEIVPEQAVSDAWLKNLDKSMPKKAKKPK